MQRKEKMSIIASCLATIIMLIWPCMGIWILISQKYFMISNGWCFLLFLILMFAVPLVVAVSAIFSIKKKYRWRGVLMLTSSVLLSVVIMGLGGIFATASITSHTENTEDYCQVDRWLQRDLAEYGEMMLFPELGDNTEICSYYYHAEPIWNFCEIWTQVSFESSEAYMQEMTRIAKFQQTECDGYLEIEFGNERTTVIIVNDEENTVTYYLCTERFWDWMDDVPVVE